MSYFTVARMEADEAQQAYALVRTLAPEVRPEDWAALVAARREEGRLLALQGPSGDVFGFASYRVEECADLGRVLLVDNFLAVELNRSAPGRELLTTTLAWLAVEQRCGGMRQPSDCAQRPRQEGRVLRNYLALAAPSPDKRPGPGAGARRGGVRGHALTAAEMYPAR